MRWWWLVFFLLHHHHHSSSSTSSFYCYTFQSFALYHLFQITKNFSIQELLCYCSFCFQNAFMPATWHVCSQNWFCILCLRFILCLMIFHFARLTKTVRSFLSRVVFSVFFSSLLKGKMTGDLVGQIGNFFLSLCMCVCVLMTDAMHRSEWRWWFHFYSTFLFLCLKNMKWKNRWKANNEWEKNLSQFNFTLIACALIFALKLYLNVTMTIKIINWRWIQCNLQWIYNKLQSQTCSMTIKSFCMKLRLFLSNFFLLFSLLILYFAFHSSFSWFWIRTIALFTPLQNLFHFALKHSHTHNTFMHSLHIMCACLYIMYTYYVYCMLRLTHIHKQTYQQWNGWMVYCFKMQHAFIPWIQWLGGRILCDGY